MTYTRLHQVVAGGIKLEKAVLEDNRRHCNKRQHYYCCKAYHEHIYDSLQNHLFRAHSCLTYYNNITYYSKILVMYCLT